MRNKDRLYVALYARGGSVYMHQGEHKYLLFILLTSQPPPANAIRYHWALLAGPKIETADTQLTRYHALERMTAQEDGTTKSSWQFETKMLPTAPAASILVRIMINKISSTKKLKSLLNEENVPIRGGKPGWSCISWIEEALDVLNADEGVLAHPATSWDKTREASLEYVTKKKEQHRFDGKAEQGQFDTRLVPTFDMTLGRELIA